MHSKLKSTIARFGGDAVAVGTVQQQWYATAVEKKNNYELCHANKDDSKTRRWRLRKDEAVSNKLNDVELKQIYFVEQQYCTHSKTIIGYAPM